MNSLFIFLETNKATAILLDRSNFSCIPVTDVNDRNIKSYSYSFYQNGNYVCLTKYALEMAFQSPFYHGDPKEQQVQTDYFFTSNFFEDYKNNVSTVKGACSPLASFALMLYKIFFDAQYASSFEGFNQISFVINQGDLDTSLEKLVREAINFLSLDTDPSIVSIQQLFEYRAKDIGINNYFTDSKCLMLFDKHSAVIDCSTPNPKFKEIVSFGEANVMKEYLLYLRANVGSLPSELYDLEIAKVQSTWPEMLAQLDAYPEIQMIRLGFRLRGKQFALRASRDEVVRFLRRIVSDLVKESFGSANQISNVNIISTLLSSSFIRRLLQEEFARVTGKKIPIEIYGDDSIRHLLINPMWNFSLFQYEHHGRINLSGNKLNVDYYLSYYDLNSDNIKYLKIFKKESVAPVFFQTVLKGRFSNQERVYFEIWKGTDGRLNSIDSKVVIMENALIDYGEHFTIGLKITCKSGKGLKIEAYENFSGKKLDVFLFNEDQGSTQVNLNQQLLFRNCKVLNNYMDKKKEQSLGIF
jgi:hypothetical protein